MVDVSDSRELDCPDAEALGGKIRAAAGLAARADCQTTTAKPTTSSTGPTAAHRDWYTAEGLLNFLTQHADHQQAVQARTDRTTMITTVDGFHHPDAQRIQPRWRGERYDRHEAVQALFRMPVRTTEDREAA